jgi:hypothetical protein
MNDMMKESTTPHTPITKSDILKLLRRSRKDYIGLCGGIDGVYNKHVASIYAGHYVDVDIKAMFPLFTRKNALSFGADADKAYWWKPRKWRSWRKPGKCRLAFLDWLIKQYEGDTEDLTLSPEKYERRVFKQAHDSIRIADLLDRVLETYNEYNGLCSAIRWVFFKDFLAMNPAGRVIPEIPLFTYSVAKPFMERDVDPAAYWWPIHEWKDEGGKGRLAFLRWLAGQYRDSEETISLLSIIE